jgi:4-hydroxy-tetrahydrodipicolinate reductase
MIRVIVSGAAGRMGETVCTAVEGAPDMELTARVDPSLGLTLEQALAGDRADVLVDFSIPTTAVANIRAAAAAGVHCVRSKSYGV